MTDKPKSQSDKFKELARELEVDEDEARWDERLERVARAKPGKKPEGDLADYQSVTRDGG
ncbi:hypothetical protein [Sphingomonas sp. SRS2]|uniref:hypothetical protein n=1 Tax=Sphingomonas sp. SRS2 TaxID=133190 RepID=UPI0006184DBE|nr:hypothetical protein [Sphingomonas sp. SRS2]KKC27968.1 hypothetical protein WP12_00365 [Sphingomonas sp. SRS2]